MRFPSTTFWLSRRTFCRLAAALPLVQRPAPEARSYYGGLRVALRSSAFPELSFEDSLGKIAALGIRYLELAADHANLAEIDTARGREVRRKILDAGLSVHTLGILRLDNRGKTERVFERAQEMGLRTLVVAATRAALKRLDELASRTRLNVAIVNERETTAAILDTLRERSPRIGVASDTANSLAAGHDPAAAVAALGDRLLAIRLRDVAPLGQGRLDVPAVIKAIQALNYNGIVALDYDGASLEYLKKITGGR